MLHAFEEANRKLQFIWTFVFMSLRNLRNSGSKQIRWETSFISLKKKIVLADCLAVIKEETQRQQWKYSLICLTVKCSWWIRWDKSRRNLLREKPGSGRIEEGNTMLKWELSWAQPSCRERCLPKTDT